MTSEPLSQQPQRIDWMLVALAAANIVFAVAISDYPLPGLYGLSPAIGGVLAGQLIMLGLAAAWIPKRVGVGLFAAAGFVLLRDVLIWWRNQPWPHLFVAEDGLRAFGAMAAAQGLRLFAGWRLTKTPQASPRRGQFQLLDLLQWMTTISVLFGCIAYLHSCWPPEIRSRITPIDYLLMVAPPLLLVLPVALLVLGDRWPTKWTVVAVFLWCLLVAAGMFLADLRHGSSVTVNVLLALLPRSGLPFLGAFLAAIVLNALTLRWAGYRWR